MSLYPPSLLAPGLTLDRYELICPIAQGGMASVWVARQTGKHGFERLVAIKTILPKYAADSAFQTMFLDEARITSRIEHNNVVRVLDVGEQHGTTYLVMEYVDGDALSTIHRTLKKSGASAPQGVLLRIMADVCGGLHTAHELRGDTGDLLGVVHRDVSPHNILVSSHGDAKLIDFGIAKALDRVAGDTNTGTVKGKVRYMPPEQAIGAPSDRRADIWAIGAVLYDLLSGRPPYVGENDVQTLLALTSGLPPPPLPATVPGPIANLVRRALEPAPANRFATAAEMQQAIEEAMVATKVGTGTAAVAGFLSGHLAERARTRKEMIRLGLQAAADREMYASLLCSSVQTMATGATSRAMGDGLLPQALGPSGDSAVAGGTLGSAAMGLVPRRIARNRTSIRVAVAATLIGTAALATIAVRLSVAQPAAGANPAGSAFVAPASQTGALPSESAAQNGSLDEVPNLAASPDAQDAASVLRLAPAASAARAAAPQSSPAKGRSRKPRVDDGF